MVLVVVVPLVALTAIIDTTTNAWLIFLILGFFRLGARPAMPAMTRRVCPGRHWWRRAWWPFQPGSVTHGDWFGNPRSGRDDRDQPDPREVGHLQPRILAQRAGEKGEER